MTKAQEMLAKAGLPDTKQGRAAFHKMYPTPDDFFKVHGNIFEDFPELVPMKLPINPENVILNHSPDRDYYLENTSADSSETDDDTDMYKAGGSIHIKPSHKGRFTAYKQRTGKTTEEALHSKDPHVRQMANFARNAAKWKHENGGPVMYGDGGGTKVYSTFDQSTNQTGNSYANNITSASTNIDPNGNTSQQFVRQTTNPNQTPYMRYFNDEVLGSEMNIAGANGNNMFIKPDPMMDNFLKTRTNYMSGAMAGEQMKRNGGPVMYKEGGPFEEQTGEDPFAAGKSYLEGWQSSPMFKNIIQNQAEAMYPSKPKSSADYYKRNTTPMYIPQGKSLMGVSAKNNDPNLYARYFPKDIIGIDKGLMDRDSALGNNLYTRAAVLDYNPTTAMDDEIINNTPAKRVKGEYNEYEYGDPLKADIHGLRQAGQAAGIYDPFTTPFKKEYINQYNEFYKTNPSKNPLNNLLKFYTPEQVEYFMNNISQNQSTPGNNMQMAAVGGMVNTFVGPPDDEIPRLSSSPTSAPYDRFPKKDPGFGNRGPGSYVYYMDRLKNRDVKTVNPHAGVKDAIIDTNTITGSCESGTCYEFEDGGVVDALQLMGMPTPRMFGPGGPTNPNDMSLFSMTYGKPNRYFETKQEGDKYYVQQRGDFPLSNQQFKNWNSPSATFASPNQLNEWHSIGANEYNKLNSQAVDGRIGYQTYAQGGHINHYIPSYNFGHVQSKNNTYRHGFANGGPIGKYDFGSTIKTIGAAAYGAGEGLLDTVTMGATDQLTDAGYDALQKAGGSSESEKHKQNAWHGGFQTAGAVTGGILNPASLRSAITEGSEGVGEVIGEASPNSENAQKWRKGITMAGGIAGMATGAGAFGTPGGGAAGLAKTNSFNASDLGKFAGKAGKVGQGFNAMNSGNPMQMMSMFGGMGGGSNMGTGSNYPMAMGGAVNAPNMMKYDAGSNVPNQDNTSLKDQYNLFLKAKPVTKYFSNAFPAHPKDGSMDPRGTVTGSVDPQTGKPIEINVEANEANWRLPNKTNFITTKKDTEKIIAFDKNGDGIAKASAMANIARAKLIKDAKAKAQQEQMMQQQDMMMQQQMMPQDIMSAQYGGMVGQYGYGGGVKMYDGGGTTAPRGIYPNRIPYAQEQRDVNWGYQPNVYKAINLTGIQPAPPPPPYLRHYGMYPNETPYQQEAGENWNSQSSTYNPTNIPGLPGYGKMEGKYLNQYPYRVESGENWGGQTPNWTNRGGSPPPIETDMEGSPSYQYGDNPGVQTALADQDKKRDMMNSTWQPGSNYGSDGRGTDVSGYSPTTGSEQNGYDYNQLLDMVPFAATAGLGLEALLQKPFNMNAADYQIKGRVDPYEEEYRPDYRPYNAAVANLNRMPGSGNLAARTNLFNAAEQNYADQRYKVNQANLARKMQADQYNISLEGQNLSTAMNIAQFNEQNKASRRNAIREQFGKNLPADIYNYQTNQMGREGLSARYQDHEFSWDRRNRRNGRSV